MMRAVIDTNVIISGLFWRGLPQQIYRAAIEGRCIPLITPVLLDELHSTLSKQRFVSRLTNLGLSIEQIMAQFESAAQQVIPADVPADVVRDAKDRAILACAVGGNADVIVSGDKDLLVLQAYRNIPIVDVAQFLERLAGE